MTTAPDRRPRDPTGRQQAIVQAAGRNNHLGVSTNQPSAEYIRRGGCAGRVPPNYFSYLEALQDAPLTHAATTATAYLSQ
ncbi:hypothetical protein DIJ64_09670 [Mycobacterium leprae]|uniref:Uncharacterized protein n=1 Tax=Mycobacterium leprae TaxID=1769 RepID=A0AAD2JDY0_MYCLR|nr:hypothetical protein DIJ64_09670 [Mycobacterium leprae]